MTALYTMVMRMARKEDGKIISEYFKAFKANFKQATILWLIFGGLIAFMTFDIWLLRSITGTFGMAYRVILFDAVADTDSGGTSDHILSFHFGGFSDRIIRTGVSGSDLFCRSF